MLGFKRQSYETCPERAQIKVLKDDAASIYESTLRKLFAGGISDRKAPLNSIMSETVTSSAASRRSDVGGTSTSTNWGCCGTGTPTNSIGEETRAPRDLKSEDPLPGPGESICCLKENHGLACFYCRRKICLPCSQYCDGCQQHFCTSCSLPNFSERNDRVFCLDCYGSGRKEIPTMEF